MTLLLTVSRSVFAFVLAKCTFGQPLKAPLQITIRFRFTPFACTQSTMDSENVHPQRQPTLRPSLGKAQIEMRRVETTDQLLRKGHADQTCENSPAAGAPTVASFSYMAMGTRTALARGPLSSSLTGARTGAAALCICEEEEEQQEAPWCFVCKQRV